MLLLFALLELALGASSPTWVIQLDPSIDPRTYAHEHHAKYVKPLGFLPNNHVFTIGEGKTARDVTLSQHEEQVPKMLYKRTIDSLWGQAWHLYGESISSVDSDKQGTLSGKGVIIGIVDDGLQHTHPELHLNYNTTLSRNFNSGSPNDPSPTAEDMHGTSCAGVAAGVKDNGICGRGVAYGAQLVGIRLISEGVTDMQEAEALSLHSDLIHIYSNSWGPVDSGTSMEGPSRLTREVLARYAGDLVGRNGKGSIYVWASGNGRHNQDSCAFDSYAGNVYVNAIGAVDYDGKRAWYSEACSNLLCVAPSSGTPGKGITTSDLLGSAGYSPTECTSGFGGTSSATPLSAGIFALLLEQNPNLTYRDLRHVVARGATVIDAGHPGWHTNAANYSHSNEYGFGLLKIPKLLETLRVYTPVPRIQKQNILAPQTPNVTIRNPATNVTFTVNDTKGITFIEAVIVRVALEHPHRGHVLISVTSPSGTTSVLAPRRNDLTQDYPTGGWSFSSLHFWGETQSAGQWVISFEDLSTSYNPGKVTNILMGVFGY